MRQPLTNRTTRRRFGLAAAGVAALALAAPAVASAADTGSTSAEQARVIEPAQTTAACGGAVVFDDVELQRLIDEGKVVRATPAERAELTQTIELAPGGLPPAVAITVERLDGPNVPALPILPADVAPGVVISQPQPC